MRSSGLDYSVAKIEDVGTALTSCRRYNAGPKAVRALGPALWRPALDKLDVIGLDEHVVYLKNGNLYSALSPKVGVSEVDAGGRPLPLSVSTS